MAAKKVDEKTLLQKSTLAKKELDIVGRHYVINDDVLNSQTKRYNYLDQDTKLLRFAQGSMGTLSDTFILYAVAMLGISERVAIQNFLFSLSRKNSDLFIADPEDSDGLKSRLKALVQSGFLFRVGYSYDVVNPMTNEVNKQENVMYTLDEGALRFVTQKLGIRLASNQWIAAKPLEEHIAWADSAHVISTMGRDESFKEYRQGIFRCKELRITMMTAELVTSIDDKDNYIACFPAFIHQNKRRQTDKDFERANKDRIAVIRNYMFVRAKDDKEPYVVIACEDLADMERMATNIIEDGTLLDYLGRIFFVGEGCYRAGHNIANCMFRLFSTEQGYNLLLADVPFLKGTTLI